MDPLVGVVDVGGALAEVVGAVEKNRDSSLVFCAGVDDGGGFSEGAHVVFCDGGEGCEGKRI